MRLRFHAGIVSATLLATFSFSEPVRALDEEPQCYEGFFGAMDPAAVCVGPTGEFVSFRFPTAYGVVLGGKTVNGNQSTVKLSLEGAGPSESVSMRSQPLSAGVTEMVFYFSTTESATFRSTAGHDLEFVSTTVGSCSELPTLALAGAVHAARVASDDVVPTAGVTDETYYFALTNDILVTFEHAAPDVLGCQNVPRSFPASDCLATSFTFEQCISCCDAHASQVERERFQQRDEICLNAGIPLRFCPLHVVARYDSCMWDCQMSFTDDHEPPCGLAVAGVCMSSCDYPMHEVPGHCGLGMDCCGMDPY
jgi:hypothetical protein